jgi:hypothetical protein
MVTMDLVDEIVDSARCLLSVEDERALLSATRVPQTGYSTGGNRGTVPSRNYIIK